MVPPGSGEQAATSAEPISMLHGQDVLFCCEHGPVSMR